MKSVISLLRNGLLLSLFGTLLVACGSKDESSSDSSAATGMAATDDGAETLPSGEYPAMLIGKYADRDCAEAKMIAEAADLWSGFEIKQYERTEQALTCAPLAVSRNGVGYQISEQCLVAGVGQQVTRESTFELSDRVMTVTLDGVKTEFQRCEN